ncbi:adenylate/guanylate cyclase domain-containing protein [Bradyrhizobium sp. SSUT18]|uniref:adenylate/guanylate cyclase domain-containing protein n=1 Tax=unclassified Bradyrhizobium TaxID=2631580 RepID=UPI00244B5144|nr:MULTISPECIES: adenylate/guanylate cyclase domain-containing protein [unclassified Bradyrhizobium]MDH2353171.1 adenylate/guanylate cyclase domain-containing protein [Bradyrhizobium sp. SSUT112]MDH2402626.1 adenylate/guanylate cyclase domain-containing protein [Bradyrhizobium sp. SSUT18]
MSVARAERRLAAVLAADVVGYSRLMGADEEGTLTRLKAARKATIDPSIAAYRGRIVKTTGDGMLVEFASAVDAALCAVDVQSGMAAQNVDVPQEVRLELRIGIHVGDIIVDDNDIFGDGVNIAARLEGIAPPRGICLSQAAWQQVKGKIKIAVQDIGDQRLKNIADPVRVYSVNVDSDLSTGDGVTGRAGPTSSGGISVAYWRRAWVVALAVLIAVIFGTASFVTRWGYLQPTPAEANRLSVVVLPFNNLSGDAGQDYIADVLTEELTTRVSRLPGSFVVSRTTAFTFRGKAFNVKQIGRELNVRYALEGSAQKSGSRIRINAQLIDTATGSHLWADQFDADRIDLLQMQDEIVTRLGRALQIELTTIESSRVARTRANDPNADDLAMQCQAAVLRLGPARALIEAPDSIKACERALQIDDKNVRALENLAVAISGELTSYRNADPSAVRDRAGELLARALAVDPNSYSAHFAKATVLLFTRPDGAIEEADHSVELNPSFAPAYFVIAAGYLLAGQPEKAIDVADRALRLFPHDPGIPLLLIIKGKSSFLLTRYDEANSLLRRSVTAIPNSTVAWSGLISSLAMSGHDEDAKESLRRYLALPGNIPRTIAQFKTQDPYVDLPARKDQFPRLLEGLRKAGMPEE